MITRQVTCAPLWVTPALEVQAVVSLYAWDVLAVCHPWCLLVAGFWAAYRLARYSTFRRFLIAVEAEMTESFLAFARRVSA